MIGLYPQMSLSRMPNENPQMTCTWVMLPFSCGGGGKLFEGMPGYRIASASLSSLTCLEFGTQSEVAYGLLESGSDFHPGPGAHTSLVVKPLLSKRHVSRVPYDVPTP